MNQANESSTLDLMDRCKASIWGQFVGDAICLGTHWIYDLKELDKLCPEGVTGFETPEPQHYHAGKRSGDFTHYGDAGLLMLQSLAQLGHFSPQDFGKRFISFFSAKEYKGYLDQATKGTLKNYLSNTTGHPDEVYHFQGGADDDQPASITRMAPVIVVHFRNDDFLKVIKSATLVCQSNQRAQVYMLCHALIQKALLLGSKLEDAIITGVKAVSDEPEYGREISNSTEMAFALLGKEVREATLKLGQACPLHKSFPSAIHAALKYQNDLRRAILESASAGGDNAARCAMIGTWLGAIHGMNGLPTEWCKKVNAKDEIDKCIEKIISGLKA